MHTRLVFGPVSVSLVVAVILAVSTVQATPSHSRPRPPLKRDDSDNDGIHLAVQPNCGPLSGSTVDVNAGVNFGKIKTIVSFGDSYTSGGSSDGSPLEPAVLNPPYPLAGGRSTNGLLWVEHVATTLNNATLMDYAQAGACTDLSIWPSNPNKVDFIGQVKTFQAQGRQLDPESTIYGVFFGINDFVASLTDGDHMKAAADSLLNQIKLLASPPTNARNFLVLDVYGRGSISDRGEAWKKTIFSALSQYHLQGIPSSASPANGNTTTQINFSYVDFATIFNKVFASTAGYEAFGYTSSDACIFCTANGCDMTDMCDDPEHWFQWYPGHPSKETMKIMADYVQDVFTQCQLS